MPAPLLDCFYSLSSPWAYLGGPQLQDIVRRHHAQLVLRPYDFQQVAPRNGGVPLRTRPEARRTYHALELDRWRRHLGLPLNLTPRHYRHDGQPPEWNKQAGWMVIAAQLQGLDAFVLSHALLRALWAEERDIADAATRIAIADENGYPGAALQAMERSDAVQSAYAENTEQAHAQGVFGAPTIVFAGERFWGQDRFMFLDQALALARSR
jgi:2-hydroxychromene-2-carboxylate isomerase